MNYLIVVGSKNVNGKAEESILILGMERQKYWVEYRHDGRLYTLEDMIKSIDIKYSDTIYVYNITDNVRNELKRLHYDFRLIDNSLIDRKENVETEESEEQESNL